MVSAGSWGLAVPRDDQIETMTDEKMHGSAVPQIIAEAWEARGASVGPNQSLKNLKLQPDTGGSHL